MVSFSGMPTPKKMEIVASAPEPPLVTVMKRSTDGKLEILACGHRLHHNKLQRPAARRRCVRCQMIQLDSGW